MKDALPEATTFGVVDALAPVRRRLGIQRVAIWALHGLGAGTTVALAWLALGHGVLLPGQPLPVAVGAMVVGTLTGAALGGRRWPTAHDAARTVDRHFALHDRLITALEYRSSAAPFHALQRGEVARRVDGLKLEEGGRVAPDGREVAGIGVLLVAFVALLLMGGTAPGHSSVVAAAEQRYLQRVTAARVHQITVKAGQGLTPATRGNPALRTLQLTLERLRRQLEHASTRPAALRAISATQAKLHHLAASLHPISQSAVAQLNGSLAHTMTARQRAAAASSDRKALAAAAQTLRNLGARLNHMTAAQRAQLARALAKAANAASDSHLQAPLRQAASSLGYNDPQSAASALRSAASALAQTPAQRAAQARVTAASRRLDGLKNAVSGASAGNGERIAAGTPSRGLPATGSGRGKGGNQSGGSRQSKSGGTAGKGTGNGAGGARGNGSGKASGPGNGTGHGAPGSGRGSGVAAASGAGNGQGAPGAHGAGGGRGGAGHTGQGRYTTVYVPYTQGKGPSITQTGPTGAPQSGPIVPYQQVVGTYSQTAHGALDRANLPPSLRSYVRKYFSTVSH